MLILAAFDPELAPFSEPLRSQGRTVGVGLVTAAHATARLLASLRPRAVVLVGSCGAYDAASVAVGSVIVAEHVVLVDAAAVQGYGAIPGPMNVRAEVDPALLGRFEDCGCVPGVVASTLGITTSDDLARGMAQHGGARFENLEAFAVVEACAAAGVPCAVVLGVTNVVGSKGRAQWQRNHVEVAARVAHLVEETVAKRSTKGRSRA